MPVAQRFTTADLPSQPSVTVSALPEPERVMTGAVAVADPRMTGRGPDASHHGPPPAFLFFGLHKTGSTFLTPFMHDLSVSLGLCWYTDNAAFMYKPKDHSKCSSPSCGHPPGSQRSFTSSDLGWGDCSGFASAQLTQAAGCNLTSSPQCQTPPQSAETGFMWGPLRLPIPMRAAMAHLGTGQWKWRVVLHQRHPLDALVSGYHSFGWTHPPALSASAEQRAEHFAQQSVVRNQSVDEYVLSHMAEVSRRWDSNPTRLESPDKIELLKPMASKPHGPKHMFNLSVAALPSQALTPWLTRVRIPHG